jgi:hypothetical protein
LVESNKKADTRFLIGTNKQKTGTRVLIGWNNTENW